MKLEKDPNLDYCLVTRNRRHGQRLLWNADGNQRVVQVSKALEAAHSNRFAKDCHFGSKPSSSAMARSSFNSETLASILARLKSFIGRPATISSRCPLLRTGKEQ